METKTRRSRRTIRLPGFAADALRDHRKLQEELVFTTGLGPPLDPDTTTKLVKKALMGLGDPPRIVMEIAGHSGVEMTMNVYSHVSLDDTRAALDKLGDLFGEEEQ